MRTAPCALLVLAFFAIPALAQTKMAAKQSCAKADPSYSIDVMDRDGHALALHKSTCSYDTPFVIQGIKSKDAVDVATSDVSGMTMTDNGYNTTTMDDGDKFTVHYQGHAATAKDKTATFAGKWVFVGGTGKLKGIKGGGTYKGAGKADGSSSIDIEGEYSLVAAATEKPASKMAPSTH